MLGWTWGASAVSKAHCTHLHSLHLPLLVATSDEEVQMNRRLLCPSTEKSLSCGAMATTTAILLPLLSLLPCIAAAH